MLTLICSITIQGKCITLKHVPLPRNKANKANIWNRAQQKCETEGGRLASFKSTKDIKALKYLHSRSSIAPFAFIGLVNDLTMMSMYR